MQLFYAFYNTCNKNFNGVYRLDKMFVSIFLLCVLAVDITQLEHEINSTHLNCREYFHFYYSYCKYQRDAADIVNTVM